MLVSGVFAWHRRNIYKGPLSSEEHERHPLAEDEELRSYRSNEQRRTWWSLSSCWPWPSLCSVAERTPWTIYCVSTTMTSVSVIYSSFFTLLFCSCQNKLGVTLGLRWLCSFAILQVGADEDEIFFGVCNRKSSLSLHAAGFFSRFFQLVPRCIL